MDRVYARCAGIDVHKDLLVVCVRLDGQELPVESFGATTGEILRLGDWLVGLGVTIVAMEATGVYWQPIWNLLEDRLELMLVNAAHLKRVPGRKTDVTDSQWIAQLLECGLLKASFVPDRPQRQLRDLTRQRSQLMGDRARVINRIQKVLESANLKIGSLFSDLAGASGRKVLTALVEGQLSAAQMAELVDRRMEPKKPAIRQALEQKVDDHARFMLGRLVDQLKYLEGQVEAFDLRLQEVMSPLEQKLVQKLDAIPGFDVRTGQNLLAEIGTDMSRFATAAHLCSWAGLCQGNHASAGKRKSGRTRKADRWLKAALTQAAWGASRTRWSYFSIQHRRIARRRGLKRATIAVAHSLLCVAWHLIANPDLSYTDLGVDYFSRQQSQEHQIKTMVDRLKRMGCDVEIKKPAA